MGAPEAGVEHCLWCARGWQPLQSWDRGPGRMRCAGQDITSPKTRPDLPFSHTHTLQKCFEPPISPSLSQGMHILLLGLGKIYVCYITWTFLISYTQYHMKIFLHRRENKRISELLSGLLLMLIIWITEYKSEQEISLGTCKWILNCQGSNFRLSLLSNKIFKFIQKKVFVLSVGNIKYHIL